MLRFILGKSGFGKTALLQKLAAERVNAGMSGIIMLVPDQSTFDTEKSFLNLLGAEKSGAVRVLGFSSLCRYVFEKKGCMYQNVIDDGTRLVLMSLTLEQLTEKLSLFGAKNSRAVCEAMLQTLTECKKNSITPEMLRRGADRTEEGTLRTKLYEMALIFDTYNALLEQSYIDPLDDLDRLADILSEDEIFDGCVFCVDSFSGFTAQQLKVLEHILRQCSECYIALTADPLSPREEVFRTSAKTMKVVSALARRNAVEIKSPVELTENTGFKNDELTELESGIYRVNPEACESVPENIEVCAAEDFYSECEYAARKIKKLVIENGYLYSDISVITHDIEPYSGILDVIFDKYEIPYFIDVEKDVEVCPVIRLVLSIFRTVLNNFEREDVLAVLKTGLLPFSPDDVCDFENYAYVWNVRGAAFKRKFENNPTGFSGKSTDDSDCAESAERVRCGLIDPLERFRTDCAGQNGRRITELLYELLIGLKIPDGLNTVYDSLEEYRTGEGAEQVRVWNLLMEALDKTVAVCGEMRLTPKRYFELLSLQISAIKLSRVPQTIDSVTVTTAQRVRTSKSRAAFLIGCTDGSFPAVPHISGVFSDYELKILLNNDILISEDFSELACLETFMAYSCMTSSYEKLYASFPLSDLLGNRYSCSSVIGEIRNVFPNVNVRAVPDGESEEGAMLAPLPAFEAYARDRAQGGGRLSALRKIFERDGRYAERLTALERAAECRPFVIEDPRAAKELFGESLRISASQIEKFNLCRFSYFCRYGLRLHERRRAEINPMEYGTLVHYVLEKFFSRFSKDKYSSMSEESIARFASAVLREYTESYFGGADTKSGAFMYRLKTTERSLALLLDHIRTELSSSDFGVADCELNIGRDIPAYTVRLSTGERIAICGSVDRVDIMDSGGKKYLRVIDYKTGSKSFKLSDILYGLNLQMLLYLYCIVQNGKQRYGSVTPAGILYMPATAPVVTADSELGGDEIKKSIDEGLQMNGLVLDDIDVVRGMDKSENGKYIPVKIKLGTPQSRSSLATLEQFGKIFSKLDRLAADMGRQLYSGSIQASPAKGGYDACKYCPYDGACAYHMSRPNFTSGLPNDEVFKKIDEEAGENSGAACKTEVKL